MPLSAVLQGSSSCSELSAGMVVEATTINHSTSLCLHLSQIWVPLYFTGHILEKYKDKIEYERVGPISVRTLKNNTEQSSLRTSLSIVKELSWREVSVADRTKNTILELFCSKPFNFI